MLTPFQDRLAGIVSGLPESRGFALAGAGGLLVQGLIHRSTRDLDYFTVPGEEGTLVELRDALERSFESTGLAYTRRRDFPRFVRLEVGDGDEECEIDLAIDYRVLPVEPSAYGPTLAVEELAANKALALFDRAEARDFLDLEELTHHFELQSLLDLASRKDTGLTTAGFLEALSSFGRFKAADFGIDQAEYDELQATVAKWRSDLVVNRRREPPDRSHGLGR